MGELQLKQAVNSEALIYFTGHGIAVTNNLGLQEGYLATSDCAIAIDESKQITAQKGGIALASLNTLIRQADLSSLVVLLDCCHSGHFLERNLVEQTLTAFSSRKDYYLITACKDHQEAYAMKSEQHSIFTGAMLKGLSSENAGNDGQVSGDRLFDFIATQLKGSGQEPIRMGWGRSITLVKYQTKIPAVTSVVREECPYQGLKAFQKQQAEFFFGRKRVVEDIRQKLELASFVPIIGASGSGKSSVVRAGLIPWLEESGWQLLGLESSEPEVGLEPIRPGIEPLGELKRALARPFKLQESTKEVRQVYEFLDNYQDTSPYIIEQLAGLGRFLLMVDQFEEVFTLCSKEEERRRFIDLLTQLPKISASRLAVIITMRADFLEPCLNYLSLTHLIQTQAVYMPPLLGADLEEAIACPAKLQGYHYEDGLLGAILQDVGQEQGSLPLLQFALTELWEKRDRQKHLLTLQQYRDLGGVIGALDRHAEQIYIRQGEREKEWIKRIFLKLVRTGEGIKDTRQRQPKAKLLAIAGDNNKALNQGEWGERQASDILDELIRGRLLVAGQEDRQGEAWVDLAHEALMGGWKRFAQWCQASRELRRLIDRLEDALREWQKNQTDENLMMGALLAQVREKWQELEPDLDAATKEFYQQSDAYEKDRIATLERLLTESRLREQAARVLNLFPSQPLDGLVLAIQSMGMNLEKLPQQILSPVQTSLHRAMETRVSIPFQGHQSSVNSVAFSPNGQQIVSGSSDNTVRLWDLQGNPISQPFQGHQSSVTSVTFSPDGQQIVSGSSDKTVRLWDLQGNPIGQPFQGHQGYVNSVAFSPDGQRIVSGSSDNTVRLWDLQGNPIGQPFQGHQGYVNSVAFSPNGQRIVSGSSDKTVRLWQGGWRAWLQVCCDRLRYHPVFKNPTTEQAKAAYETCCKYVWNKEGVESSE